MSATSSNIRRNILERLTDKSSLLMEQPLDDLMSVEPVVYGFDTGSAALMHDPYYQTEIVEDVSVTSIPNTEAWFMGMTVLRGYLIPVFDVGVLFGGSSSNSNMKTTIAVVGSNDEAAALSIASLPKRILPDSLSSESEESIRVPDFLKPAIREQYSFEETSWLDVDFAYFFELLGEHVNKSYDFSLAAETTH